MPLTPNGKIDKVKLPFPDAAIMAQQIKYAQPMGHKEHVVHLLPVVGYV